MSILEQEQKPGLLNTSQAAIYLGISPTTVRKWALSKKLTGVKSGKHGSWSFSLEDLSKLKQLTRTNESKDPTPGPSPSLLNLNQLRAIFEAVPGLYLILKPDAPRLTIVEVSDAYARATLVKREDIIERPLFEVFPDSSAEPDADNLENLNASLLTVIQTKKPHTMPTQTYSILRADTTFEERYWDTVNSPVFDDNGQLSFIIHSVVDVTSQNLLVESKRIARRERKDERQHFYDLFMHAPAFIAVLSGPDLTFELANPLYHQLVGADRKLEGVPLLEALPDIDPQLLDIVRNVAFKGERFVANELAIFLDWDSNNTPYTKFVTLIYNPLLDQNNVPDGLICFGFDVTHQMQARQEVETLARRVEQQARTFDTVLTSVQDFIYTFDTAGRFTYSNFSLLNLLGITLEEIIGKNFHELPYPEELAATLQNHIAKVLETGKPIVAETAYTNPAGIVGFYEYIFVPIVGGKQGKTGAIEAVAGSTRDITGRKQTEAALEKSQLQLKALTEANIIGVVNCDLAGDIFEANNVFLELLGHTRNEVAAGQLNLDALTPLKHRAKDAQARQQLLAGDTVTPWEKEFIRKDGMVVPVIFGLAVVNKESGECIAFVLDITERKRLEERKDEFLSIASHELKTPLASIKGYTQLLERQLKGGLDEKTRGYFTKTLNYANRLNELITDLLDVSKIQAGKLELNISEFDFDELVRDGVESVEIEPETTAHRIEIVGTADIVITADRNRLEQVFTNLLTNAIKYSPEANRVIVRVNRSEDAREVEVAVQDFGLGISQETQSKIFERYYRVQNIANQYSGLGIGLYISYEIVRRHKGWLTVKSVEGEGSTFTFMIPVEWQETGSAQFSN